MSNFVELGISNHGFEKAVKNNGWFHTYGVWPE